MIILLLCSTIPSSVRLVLMAMAVGVNAEWLFACTIAALLISNSVPLHSVLRYIEPDTVPCSVPFALHCLGSAKRVKSGHSFPTEILPVRHVKTYSTIHTDYNISKNHNYCRISKLYFHCIVYTNGFHLRDLSLKIFNCLDFWFYSVHLFPPPDSWVSCFLRYFHRYLSAWSFFNCIISGIHSSDRHKWPQASVFHLKIWSHYTWGHSTTDRNFASQCHRQRREE